MSDKKKGTGQTFKQATDQPLEIGKAYGRFKIYAGLSPAGNPIYVGDGTGNLLTDKEAQIAFTNLQQLGMGWKMEAGTNPAAEDGKRLFTYSSEQHRLSDKMSKEYWKPTETKDWVGEALRVVRQPPKPEDMS